MTFNQGIMVERLGGIDDRPRRAARVDRRLAGVAEARGSASRCAPASRTSRATSSATACASTTRSTAPASRPSCCCRPGRSSTRATGRCRSRTSRATAASSTFDGRGNGRSDRPARRGYDEREFAADALAVMDATGDRARASSSALSLGAQRALLLAAEHPERVDGRGLHRPAVPLAPRRVDRARRPAVATTSSTTDEGWAKYNRHYWLRGLPRLPRVLLRADVHRAALDQADRGLRRLGARDDAARRSIAHGARRADPAPTTRARRCAARACAARSLVIHGDATTRSRRHARGHRAGGGDRRRAGRCSSGSGHGPHARDPVQVNLLLRDFVAPPRPPAALGARAARAPQARALHLLADRARPRPARRRDRRRAAQAAPRPRDRLARAAPGHRGARGARRAHPPGERASSPASRATSSRESAEHDLHCFQAIRRMDEILVANFMVFHDVVRDERLRPVDRRRGLGARLLPAREPGAEARSRTPG